MQVKRIAECSKGSILQYLRPALSYHLSLRYVCLFCLFLSGRLRHGLLYCNHLDDRMSWLLYFNCIIAFMLGWSQSLMSIFCGKIDNLSAIAIYKLYMEKFLSWT